MTTRRGFLEAMLAAAVAPAFLRPTSLMPLWVPKPVLQRFRITLPNGNRFEFWGRISGPALNDDGEIIGSIWHPAWMNGLALDRRSFTLDNFSVAS